MRKFKHKETGKIVKSTNESIYRWEDWMLPSWLVENSSDWEEIEELCVPVGTKFKHKMPEDEIYTIDSVKGKRVIVSWDNGKEKNDGYAINEANKYFKNGYWIKVEDKDYEILSYKYIEKIYTLTSEDNGEGKVYRCSGGGIIQSESVHILNGASIHSVRILSDGTVFKLGDKIECLIDNEKATIEKFILRNNDIGINKGEYGWCYVDLKSVIHAKQPLFTTEDGKEIFDKGEYFIVGDNYNIISTQATDNTKYKDGIERFSTKEAAQEYIDYNKPKYSLKDVEDSASGFWNRDVMLERLRKLK